MNPPALADRIEFEVSSEEWRMYPGLRVIVAAVPGWVPRPGDTEDDSWFWDPMMDHRVANGEVVLVIDKNFRANKVLDTWEMGA